MAEVGSTTIGGAIVTRDHDGNVLIVTTAGVDPTFSAKEADELVEFLETSSADAKAKAKELVKNEKRAAELLEADEPGMTEEDREAQRERRAAKRARKTAKASRKAAAAAKATPPEPSKPTPAPVADTSGTVGASSARTSVSGSSSGSSGSTANPAGETKPG